MTIDLAPLFVTIQDYVDAAFAEENAELLARIAEMQTAINSYEAEIETLEAQIDGKDALIAEQIAEISTKNTQIAALQDTIDGQDAQIAWKNAQIEALEADIVDLEAQLAEATVFPVITGISDRTVNETDSSAVFTVTMDRTSTRAVNIDYATVNGTAIAGQDYTATSGILVIVPGALSATVSVPIINDTAVESNEAFTLSLSNARLSLAMNDATGSGTIISEDTTTTPPPGTWPDATNTGSTGTLTAYTGSSSITATVTILNKSINKSLRVTGNNVRFINCKFDYSDTWGIDADGANGLLVEDCTFIGHGGNSAILSGGNATVRRCNISGMENGIVFQQGACLAEANYIHDLNNPSGDPHYDGISIQGGQNGTIVRGNHIEAWDTSCVFIKCDFGAITNTLVENNRLINTPGKQTAYPVYSVRGNSGQTPTGTIFRNNVLQRGNGGYFSIEGNVVRTGNTDYITGAPVS